jgi:hypothetical protein
MNRKRVLLLFVFAQILLNTAQPVYSDEVENLYIGAFEMYCYMASQKQKSLNPQHLTNMKDSLTHIKKAKKL